MLTISPYRINSAKTCKKNKFVTTPQNANFNGFKGFNGYKSPSNPSFEGIRFIPLNVKNTKLASGAKLFWAKKFNKTLSKISPDGSRLEIKYLGGKKVNQLELSSSGIYKYTEFDGEEKISTVTQVDREGFTAKSFFDKAGNTIKREDRTPGKDFGEDYSYRPDGSIEKVIEKNIDGYVSIAKYSPEGLVQEYIETRPGGEFSQKKFAIINGKLIATDYLQKPFEDSENFVKGRLTFDAENNMTGAETFSELNGLKMYLKHNNSGDILLKKVTMEDGSKLEVSYHLNGKPKHSKYSEPDGSKHEVWSSQDGKELFKKSYSAKTKETTELDYDNEGYPKQMTMTGEDGEKEFWTLDRSGRITEAKDKYGVRHEEMIGKRALMTQRLKNGVYESPVDGTIYDIKSYFKLESN